MREIRELRGPLGIKKIGLDMDAASGFLAVVRRGPMVTVAPSCFTSSTPVSEIPFSKSFPPSSDCMDSVRSATR
jgi:hypothetical protein